MLTVLMATYNGARTLPEVLNSYCKIESPEGGWKLVVVDNGSSDRTREILLSFSQSLPLILVFEPKRGKNSALNTGLSSVEGDLVLFTDDDVVPTTGLLKHMRRAADSQPSFSIFGGPIQPQWEVTPEDWLLDCVPLDCTFGVTPPLDEGPVSAGWIFGGNMAARSSIFDSGHRFNESMGPGGSDYPQGSETDLLLRLEKAGHKSWHVKDAVVKHIIKSHQMNHKWVLGRAVRFGRGQYRLGGGYYQWPYGTAKPSLQASFPHLSKTPVRSHLGISKSLLWQLLLQGLRVARAKLRANEKEIFQERWLLNYLIGGAREEKAMAKYGNLCRIVSDEACF